MKLLRSISHSRLAMLSVGLIALVCVMAIAAAQIAPYDPIKQDLDHIFEPPGKSHRLGTDYLGRDVFSRVVYGSRISLTVGFCTVLISTLIGVSLGLVAGFRGGATDGILMRFADAQMAIPYILLVLVVVAVIGPSLKNIILVLGVADWVVYGRTTRSQVLSVRETTFVEAAKAYGASEKRIMLRHVLPEISSPIIVLATLRLPRMIIVEATLSYLGLGVQPPTPTWGSMLSIAQDHLFIAWWSATFPGLAILITVLGINLFGDWFRDFLDPRVQTF